MIINDIVVDVEPKETMTVTLLTTTTLEDIRFYATKKTDDDDDVDEEAYRRALGGCVGKTARKFLLETRVQKAKTERLLPLETKELVDALREEGSADAVLTDNRDEDENMVRAVFEKSNPTVAGEMFAMNEIYRRDEGGGGGFDANAAAAEKGEEGGILSRKTDGVLGGSGE